MNFDKQLNVIRLQMIVSAVLKMKYSIKTCLLLHDVVLCVANSSFSL